MNFECQSVLDLTDLTKAQTEPPVTIGMMSNDELDQALETPLNLQLPVSSMAVERGVKIVTRAANVTADPVEQDGFSFQTIAAVKKNSVKNRKKKVWKNLLN